MYTVIGGAGEVGYYLARLFYTEGHEIAIIESEDAIADHAETLDALVVRGNAASPKKLIEAGIEEADLYVGVTGYDEVNMISSSFAKSKGVKTIARINKIEYIDKPIS
ncbi:MAG: NAD-binding protein, partial [Candidatus Thermoplasmatota archaeon]